MVNAAYRSLNGNRQLVKLSTIHAHFGPCIDILNSVTIIGKYPLISLQPNIITGVHTGRVAGAQDRGKSRSVLVQPELLGDGGDGEHVGHAAETQLAAGEASRGQVHGEGCRGHGRGAVRHQRHGVRLLLDRQST